MAIRSVFDRPMFRNPNITNNNMPSGIMASGPSLIKATFTPPRSEEFYKKQEQFRKSPSIRERGVEDESLIKSLNEMTLVEKEKQSELQKLLEEQQKKDLIEKGKTTVDSFEEINKTNENLLTKDFAFPSSTQKGIRGSFDLDKFSTNENVNQAEFTPSMENVKNKMMGFTKQATSAVNELATGTTSAENVKLGGMTLADRMEDYVNFTKQKGEEPTLADIKDDAIKLLQFDPSKLDEQYDEDREASIWLNMIKSGLAIAAGESDNALTNIAKGFAVGLDGYGGDVARLKKDLREDKKNAQQTMYTLLRDAKSEALAKRTLEQQQKLGLLEIQRNLVGDKKKEAMDIFNRKMAMAKWNVDLLGTLTNMQFKEKELALSEENIKKTFEASLIKAQPDVINYLKSMDHLKLKEGSDGSIQYGQPGYFAQFEMTPTGEKIMQKFISGLTSKVGTGLGSEFKTKFTTLRDSGSVGIFKAPSGYSNLSDTQKDQFGIAAENLLDNLKNKNELEAFQLQYEFSKNMTNQLGVDYKIKFKDLSPNVQRIITDAQKRNPNAYSDIDMSQ